MKIWNREILENEKFTSKLKFADITPIFKNCECTGCFKKTDKILKCFLLYILLIFGNSNLMQLPVYLICVSLLTNIFLYCANFRSSNHCACACDF